MSTAAGMSNVNTIPSRIESLRAYMESEGITMVMIPTSDPHDSEYVGDHYKFREWLTGFTGSNAKVIVTKDEAGLWTDGRYFIQAANELEGSGIILFREREPGVPTVKEYVKSHISSGDVFAVDGRLITAKEGEDFAAILAEAGAEFKVDVDPASAVWEGRPGADPGKIFALGTELTGISTADKLTEVRSRIKEAGADIYVLSKLDDICFLADIRGNDIACTPVAYSYMYITSEEAHIFLYEESVGGEVRAHLEKAGITIHTYADFNVFLNDHVSSMESASVFIDSRSINFSIYKTITDHARKVIDKPNPTTDMESVRNETQLERIREVYVRDSAALTRFLFWMKENVGKEEISEYSAALRIDEMRSKIEGFIELSFDTISAYGPNAAMMHYEATPENFAMVKPEGMYLVDSGGQYMGGTTDVTRTIAVGEVTDEMRKSFTLVCIGMLRLADAVFIEGCTGRNLDILAREPLWKNCLIDYKCGTGHGVGFMLGVHTGPENIRSKFVEGMREAPLKAGMTLSDEPGVYIEGEYGIRTENILEVVDAGTSPDGHFLKFEHLTWVPIDLELIDISYMEPHDIELLNRYHEGVYSHIAPFMEDERELAWLKNATKSI